MIRRALLVVALVGCGGTGSGVDGSLRLATLTADAQSQLCVYLADAYPERTVQCTMTDQRMGGAPPVPQCLNMLQAFATANPACPATVAQAEACYTALAAYTDGEVCVPPALPTVCAPLRTPDCNK
jgi:hypothetical protein